MLSLIPDRRALLLKSKEGVNYLVVADLHIGFERELAQRGLKIPSQTEVIANKIRVVGAEVDAERLIILGDVKHSVTGFSLEELKDVPKFFEMIEYYFDEIIVVCGNHDGDLQDLLSFPKVKVIGSRGLVIEDSRRRLIGLIHGHAWPSLTALSADLLVMAHIHPVVELRDSLGFKFSEAVWIRAPVRREALVTALIKSQIPKEKMEIKLKEVIIMPAFNEFLGGLIINRDLDIDMRSPLLNSGGIGIEEGEVFLLDGTYLGKLSFLRGL